MHPPSPSAPGTVPDPDARALRLISDRLNARIEDIAQRLAQTYRDEVVEYRAFADGIVERDVLPLASEKIRQMLTSLMTETPPAEEEIRLNARAAVRRFHQAIPLQALLRAYRVRERTVWDELVDCADLDDPAQLRVLLRLAGRVMEHIDIMSSAVVQAYVEEQAGLRRNRPILRSEVLEALIHGRATPEVRARLQDALDLQGFDLNGRQHAIVTFRFAAGRQDFALAQEVTSRFLGEPLEGTTRGRLGLLGLRDEEIVWLVEAPEHGRGLQEAATHAVQDVDGLVAGVGSSGEGVEHAAVSYRQARAATDIALTAPGADRVQTHRDVLLDLALAEGADAAGLVESALEPLLSYDRDHGTDLIGTLEAYIQHRYQAARAATVLHVRPNTVLYRLKRIARITGHDPMHPDGLLVLSLGIRTLRSQRRA
jgi:sugar diacid utilization regulator